MATIKVACPKCGQKVSGDETFYGSTVECPICSSDILFPGLRRDEKEPETFFPVPVPAENPPRPVPPAEEKRVVAPGELPQAPVESFPESKWESGLEATGGRAIPPRSLPSEDEESDLPPSPIFGAISIVSAVLSIVTCFVGGILFAPLAIIFGHTALAKARHSPIQPAPGHTLGAIGLMIGYVSLFITIILLLLAVLFDTTIREMIQKARE